MCVLRLPNIHSSTNFRVVHVQLEKASTTGKIRIVEGKRGINLSPNPKP